MCQTLFFGLALAAAAPQLKDPLKDLRPLLGWWDLVSMSRAGATGYPGSPQVWRFTEDSRWEYWDGARLTSGDTTFTVGPAADARRIDFDGDRQMAGVYRVDGDTLTVCVSLRGPRPTEFASPPGSQDRVYVLRRARK